MSIIYEKILGGGAVSLAAIAFLVYSVLPTKNYYWDGVSFAQNIEQAGTIGSASFWTSLVHPNHLLYDMLGYFSWKAVTSLGIGLRAIAVLQGLSMLAGAASVGFVYSILLKITKSSYLALSLALCFGFSAVFWKFSTDADAYIVSLLFLILAFRSICSDAGSRAVVIAILHALAMLFHQLAVFFFPAAAIAMYLKGGRRALFQYCGVVAVLTAPAFYFAFWLSTSHTDGTAFLAWLTSHAEDVTFTFSIAKNLAITLANYPRMFFGGTGHLLQFFGPKMCVGFFLLAISIGAFLKQSVGHFSEFKALLLRPILTCLCRSLLLGLSHTLSFSSFGFHTILSISSFVSLPLSSSSLTSAFSIEDLDDSDSCYSSPR